MNKRFERLELIQRDMVLILLGLTIGFFANISASIFADMYQILINNAVDEVPGTLWLAFNILGIVGSMCAAIYLFRRIYYGLDAEKNLMKNFKDDNIEYMETIQVKDGVSCDVYSFVDDNSKDLGIISVKKGAKTPLQRVLKGDKTIEGYLSGEGTLTVGEKIYNFPNKDQKEVEVRVGETMQWEAKRDLIFYEICYPPYKDGRYEDLG